MYCGFAFKIIKDTIFILCRVYNSFVVTLIRSPCHRTTYLSTRKHSIDLKEKESKLHYK